MRQEIQLIQQNMVGLITLSELEMKFEIQLNGKIICLEELFLSVKVLQLSFSFAQQVENNIENYS